jgi:hypothetical protein
LSRVSRRTLGLPASSSTINRTPTPAASIEISLSGISLSRLQNASGTHPLSPRLFKGKPTRIRGPALDGHRNKTL